MKYITYLYIFALAVLCNPGIFMKNKSYSNILYSFIFTFILYITFDFVNTYIENYEQYNIDVKGVNGLVDLLKTQSDNDTKKIDIHNNLFQEEGQNDAKCWNALGKNQKEIEIIKMQLDSYSGTQESIDKLNTKLNEQKREVENLEEELKDLRGINREIDQLELDIKNYLIEINSLKDKLEVYKDTDDSIGEVIRKTAKIDTNITNVQNELSKYIEIGNIKQQRQTMNELENKYRMLRNDIPQQENEIFQLREKKKRRDGCIPTNSKVTLTQHCGYNGWNYDYNTGNYGTVPSGGISGIKIPSDLKITVYNEPNFSGERTTFEGPRNISCLVNEKSGLSGGNWNDRVHSYKIVQTKW